MTMTDRPTYQHPTLGAIRRGDEITFKLRDMYAPAVAHVSTVYDNAVSANGWFVDGDHILAVRRYEPEGAPRAEWRPIDEAPRDRAIIVALRGRACVVRSMCGYAGWALEHGGAVTANEPTHYLA